jgi:hypothetical protein
MRLLNEPVTGLTLEESLGDQKIFHHQNTKNTKLSQKEDGVTGIVHLVNTGAPRE